MQRIANFLIFLGLILIAFYGGFQLIQVLLAEPTIPMVIKLGLILVLVGILILLVKVIMEKIQGGDNDDVSRKY